MATRLTTAVTALEPHPQTGVFGRGAICGPRNAAPPSLWKTREVARAHRAARIPVLSTMSLGPALEVQLRKHVPSGYMSFSIEATRTTQSRGRLLTAAQVAEFIFNNTCSPQWVRRTVAPEHKVRLGHSTVRWWENDVLAWLDRQGYAK